MSGIATSGAEGWRLLLGFPAGAVLAWLHLAGLSLNLRLYLAPVPGWHAISLHALRFGAVAAAFTLAACSGSGVLLAVLAGFSLGRVAAMRHYR